VYGKGEVWFVNLPVEAMLIEKNRAFDNNVEEIYREVFRSELEGHLVKTDNENVALTIHEDGSKVYVIAVNHSETAQKIKLDTALKLVKAHYGDLENCRAMDADELEFER